MTATSTPVGLLFPTFPTNISFAAGSSLTIDAATEKVAMIGHVYMAGRTASSKTISAAGGGSLSFRPSAVTFANGATTVDLGLQDVSSSGPAAQPDGTFDVKRTLTGGTDTITVNVLNTFAMTGGTGTKTLTHGDLVAIVLDMTARGGVDTLAINGNTADYAQSQRPIMNLFSAAAWATAAGATIPIARIVFDDGTRAIIDGTLPHDTVTTEAYADATNPDERGLIFQVPWDCKIDAFWTHRASAAADGDFTMKLYSSPTSSPSLVTSMTVLAEQLGQVNQAARMLFTLPAEISLTKNTDYILTKLATGAGNVVLQTLVLDDAADRVFLPGGTTLAKGTRNNSTGNFSNDSSTLIYQMGVRISSFDDGTGSGSAAVGVIGS